VTRSDVDVLYELEQGGRLGWEIEDLADELSEVLGRPVDLVSLGALHPPTQGHRAGGGVASLCRRELLLLEEMAEAAEQAHRLVDGVALESLAEDPRAARGVALELYGSWRSSGLSCPSSSRTATRRCPWRQPVRLRNRIVHGLRSIDLEILHTTALSQLPEFAAEVRRLLAALSDEDTMMD